MQIVTYHQQPQGVAQDANTTNINRNNTQILLCFSIFHSLYYRSYLVCKGRMFFVYLCLFR